MRTVFKILLVMWILLLASSCIQERSADGNCSTEKNVEDTRIMLRLKVSGNFNGTRGAMTAQKESAIDNVYVLIFDTSAAEKLMAVRRGYDISQDASGAAFVVTVPVEENDTDDYKIVVFANAKDIIEDKLSGLINIDEITSTHSYTDVMAKLSGDMRLKTIPETGNIPMWCETTTKLTIETIDGLTLLRSVARVDVGVGVMEPNTDSSYDDWNGEDGSGTPIPFKLKEVYVVKPNTKYWLAAYTSNIEDNKAKKPSIRGGTGTNVDAGQLSILDPEEMTDYKFSATVVNDLYTIQDIYIPEAIINFGVQGVAGDANHTNRTAIVVGGEYDDDVVTTYYRIDFMGADNKLKDVLRNHLYRISIVGVNGSGHPTVKEAYENTTDKIIIESVSVADWGTSENVPVPF